EYLLKGLRIGSSLTCSVQINDGDRIRLFCLSTSSLLLAPEASELISNSDALILVLSDGERDKACMNKIKSLLSVFKTCPIAVVGKNQDISIPHKHESFILDLEELRELYLRKSPDTACQKILDIFAYVAKMPMRKALPRLKTT
ncbi:hypothetical protein DRN63_05250, partial [Nanoarchaeota archaeon]